jgi:hypothetical protein
MGQRTRPGVSVTVDEANQQGVVRSALKDIVDRAGWRSTRSASGHAALGRSRCRWLAICMKLLPRGLFFFCCTKMAILIFLPNRVALFVAIL